MLIDYSEITRCIKYYLIEDSKFKDFTLDEIDLLATAITLRINDLDRRNKLFLEID